MTDNVFIYGSVAPLQSITNTESSSAKALDAQSPFDFYNFLKYSKQQTSPLLYNENYLEYLKSWSTVKQQSTTQATVLIKDRYIELLKDISLNYLSYEEQRFIATADFTDPQDLDIAIPFFSKKLTDICNFYAQKREQIKGKIQNLQKKGAASSAQQAIFDSLADHIAVSDDSNLVLNIPSIDIQRILSKMKIEIEELYDLYSNYLDNSPNLTFESYDVKSPLRQQLYNANINTIDADLFINFDSAIKKYIFENTNIFLQELGESFRIQYNIDTVDLNCKPNEKLYDIIAASKDEANVMVNLRKRLIEKYMGTDFYYISTNTDNVAVSGLLFSAQNPTSNLLNRHYPTTASVEETENLHTIRKLGVFFRPDKMGLLYFSAPENRFIIDNTKLQPDHVYVFPDPTRYGNTTGLTNEVDAAYPLIHTQRYEKNIVNSSKYAAEGDVDVVPHKQSFCAYFSKNQINQATNTNSGGLSSNLAALYDNGVVTQWAIDIFGNQYGLFKPSTRKPLADNRTTTNSQLLTTYEVYDGGVLKFQNMGHLPDPVHADYPSWVDPNIFASNYYYNALFDGGIGRIQQGLMIRPLIAKRLYDGLFYDAPPDTTYSITLNSVNNTFSNGTLLIECGFYTDPIIYEGDFTLSYIVSSIQYKELDGGPIATNVVAELMRDTGKNLYFDDTSENRRTVVLSGFDEQTQNTGRIFIKDAVTGAIAPVSSAMSDLMKKLQQQVSSQMLSSVADFNIYNDVMYVRTPNYMIIEKITYDGMIRTGSPQSSVINNLHDLYVCSDPFFFEQRDYAMMATITAISAEHNECELLPSIYKVSYGDGRLVKVSFNNVQQQSFKNALPIKINRVTTPVLTFNSRNNLYAILCTVLDSNDMSYLYQIFFTISEESASIQATRMIEFDSQSSVTVNWYDSDSTSMFDMRSITLDTLIDVSQGSMNIHG